MLFLTFMNMFFLNCKSQDMADHINDHPFIIFVNESDANKIGHHESA